MSPVRRVLLLVAASLLLAGCGSLVPTDFPADPDGTLDRVRDGGVLRVGASPRPGWVEVGDGPPGGREPTLVRGFADHLAAEVEWTVAGEEELVRLLEDGRIDDRADGTIAGVLGIGLGLWWADSGAALLISLSIVRDGWTNLHFATTALMDERARTYDDEHPHPLTRRVDEVLTNLSWVDDSRSRVRDQGHVFHVEAFVRPVSDRTPTLDQLEAAADVLRELDWKVHDVVVVPVRDLPETIPTPEGDSGQGSR